MSFATLIETADAPFLAERFDLGYVASGWDLLRYAAWRIMPHRAAPRSASAWVDAA